MCTFCIRPAWSCMVQMPLVPCMHAEQCHSHTHVCQSVRKVQNVSQLVKMTLKIVAVFPEGGQAAKNEQYVNCRENALGLRGWCKQNDADLVVTSSKDGSDSGEGLHPSVVYTPQYAGLQFEPAKHKRLLATCARPLLTSHFAPVIINLHLLLFPANTPADIPADMTACHWAHWHLNFFLAS